MKSIGDLSESDSLALLEELTAHAAQPAHVYRHRWREGDVLMWDNRFTMHKVQPYRSTEHRRVMQRTELSGSEIPV